MSAIAQRRRSTPVVASLRGRWPEWVPYAAAAASFAYGVLGVYWAAGGAGFPFGVEHDPEAAKVSLLESATPGGVAPVIAVLGFAAAAAAVASTRARTRSRLSAPFVGLAWGLALLGVVIPDSRPLMAVARTPIVLGGKPFGWPEGVGFFEPGMYSWPVANQLLIAAIAVLWAGTALAYQRRLRGACGHCGRTDAASGWTSPDRAARWGRSAVAIAVAVPVLYALTRWSWALGIPLGVTDEFLREEARETPDIWLAGALLASVAVGGALLTLGLVRPWGEVYPRWFPFLRGRPIRPRVAIVPGAIVAVLIFTAGVHAVRAQILGHYPEGAALGEDNWGTTAPGLLWPLWGAALAAAVLAYHLRRRGPCSRCGRGS
jgi:hypothetical protein